MSTELHATRTSAGQPHGLPGFITNATLVTAALAALAVTVLLAITASGWIGRAFPGFFVLPNRTVPSIGRDTWTATRDHAVYQRTLVAVDGQPVVGNRDAYDAVARHAPGTPVELTLRDGPATERLVVETRTFSSMDYSLIFGGYLLTGLLYVWLGLLATWLRPESQLGRSLLLLGGTGGVYALTGAGLYDGGADMRLHALAEAFFPATLVYVTIGFARPAERHATIVGAVAWWLSLALAVPYLLLLGQPGAYSTVHAACETYCGIAGLGLGATLIVLRARAADRAGPLLRAGLAGALLGIGVPAVIFGLSGLSGGRLPVNVVTATAFLFPLCLGYGLVAEGTPAPHSTPVPA